MQRTHQDNIADVSVESVNTRHNNSKAYFVGRGIASLAGAAFLIRDGLLPGEAILILRNLRSLGVVLMAPVRRKKAMWCVAAG